jgi:hypothetical protein
VLVEARMKDIRAVLNSDAGLVRATFAKHIEKITMTPNGEHYMASGNWKLEGVAVSVVPGARIAPRVHLNSSYRSPRDHSPKRS